MTRQRSALRRKLWSTPVRIPGGLIYQFGQWYAVGCDHTGAERAGVGQTRAEARASLARLLNAIRRHDERSHKPTGNTEASP